jgi:hypothetical protein
LIEQFYDCALIVSVGYTAIRGDRRSYRGYELSDLYVVSAALALNLAELYTAKVISEDGLAHGGCMLGKFGWSLRREYIRRYEERSPVKLPDATEVALRVLQCNMMTFDTSMEMEQRFEIKREEIQNSPGCDIDMDFHQV